MKSPFEPTEHGIRCGALEIIWGSNTFNVFAASTMVIHGDAGLVIDPTANEEIIGQLVSAGKIKRSIYTHYHIDHRLLSRLVDHLPSYAHKLGRPWWGTPGQSMGFADGVPPEDERLLKHEQMFRKVKNLHDLRPTNFFHTDIEVFDSGELQIETIRLPGHVSSHLGIHVPKLRALWVTDCDLTDFGPWYGDASSSLEDWAQTFARLREFDAEWFFTSHYHAPIPRRDFLVKLTDFEAVLQKREDRLLQMIAEKPGSTTAELLDGRAFIYSPAARRRIPITPYYERRMAALHLERMQKQGKVSQLDPERWCTNIGNTA